MSEPSPIIPSGKRLPADTLMGTLEPGDWVYHCIFGFGEVLPFDADHQAQRLKVRFVDGEIRLLTPDLWGVGRLPSVIMWPSEKVLEVATFPILHRTTTIRSWKRSAQQSTKRHNLKFRLDHGELPGPLVESLPLPWTAAAILRGPFVGAINSEATPLDGGRHNAGSSRGMPPTHAPRAIVGSVPSFKQLRGALADAAKAMEHVGPVVVEDVLANWPVLQGMDARVIELADPLPGGLYRLATQMFLNVLRERLVTRVQSLRAKSHANGRWWPAPESLQLILKEDGCVAARMRFDAGYHPPEHPWLEWTGRRSWR
jgi:hypothetical protein